MVSMQVELVKEYRFEAAHQLPRVPATHKCRRLHGHSFKIELTVAGTADDTTGWLIDYGDIDRIWEPLYSRLDHNFLNEIDGLDNPTSENLSKWIFDRIKKELPLLRAVTVFETCDARCTYRGD